jgi:hypothetical protein
MKPRRLLCALAVIVVIVAVFLIFRGSPVVKSENAGSEVSSGRHAAPAAAPEREKPLSPARSAELAAEENFRPLAELKDTLTGKLKSMEAARVSLLSEKRVKDLKLYLLGVVPPSPEEVKELRSLIAALQKKCSKEELEQWDTDVQELLREYDGFGETGKKVIAMRVDEGKDNDLSALVFLGADFEEKKRELEAGNTLTGTGQINSYSPSQETLERFAAMMTSE